MNQPDFPRLLGDVGGTNARLAWQDRPGAAPSRVSTYACADHESLLSVIRSYLAQHQLSQPQGCAIGIANPILGDQVRMTNHHWSFSISEMRRQIGVARLKVINDFTALALSLPALAECDLRPIGRGQAVPGAAMAVLGPGTGLGVSGLIPAGHGSYLPITGEGGHVTLAASDDLDALVIQHLTRRFGHCSAERVLSGPGLVNLYDALCAIAGRPHQSLEPSQVIDRARNEGDRQCSDALALFCGFLGAVAGDLALTLGAHGGVYIGGGIAPRLLPELDRTAFRDRFESKGRFRDYLASIPTFVIDSLVSPALIGASRALDIED